MIKFSEIDIQTAIPIVNAKEKELFAILHETILSNKKLLEDAWNSSDILKKVSVCFPDKTYMLFFKNFLSCKYDESYIKDQLEIINKFDISVESYLEVFDVFRNVIFPILKEKIENKEDYFLLQESLNKVMFLDLKIISKRNILVSSLKNDNLTGLSDTKAFLNALNRDVNFLKENQILVVIVFDIRRFTKVRELFGYSKSDLILIKIKDLIFAISERYFDKNKMFLSRTGFDEFSIAIVIENLSSLNIYMDKIESEFNEPIFISGKELYINLAKGGSIYPTDSKKPDDLLKFAKIALSVSKNERNKFILYSQKYTKTLKDVFELETSIRKAIKNEEFILYYQPKIDFVTNKISGVEALIRWNKPNEGIVFPKEFIPFLEESKLIIEVGKWVFREACRQIGLWRNKGINLKIAINISQLQLVQDDFIDFIKKTLKEEEVGVDDIELELTESFLISLEENINKLQELKEMGISMSIDDFGTGYSSLSYLENLPISKIKIDLAFIKNLNSSVNRRITETIISLANKLDLKTVSEGIETEEQLNVMKSLKCDEGQGYLFSKAVPPKMIIDLYNKYN